MEIYFVIDFMCTVTVHFCRSFYLLFLFFLTYLFYLFFLRNLPRIQRQRRWRAWATQCIRQGMDWRTVG